MTGIGKGRDPGDLSPGDLSWTNEELPLEVRRALLDKALQDLKTNKAVGNARTATPATTDRAGKTGSDRDAGSTKDKPKA